ncbi:MAG: hypothetical protein Q8O76_12075, partial [Chloroflexota bacterium]|nr:hypothetical protein [Chloroflexota bacterium]
CRSWADYASDPVKRDLVAFLGRHPYAKFTRHAIYCAFLCKKPDMDSALGSMVEMGLVDEYGHNGSVFYSLTGDEDKRQAILQLASPVRDRGGLCAKILCRATGCMKGLVSIIDIRPHRRIM